MSQLYENAAGKKCRNKSKAFRPKIRRSHILELAPPPKYEKKEISSFIGEHGKGRSQRETVSYKKYKYRPRLLVRIALLLSTATAALHRNYF